MKKLLLVLPLLLMLFSCTGVYIPITDTTAPEIVSWYTSPDTVIAGQPFSLIVQTYDYESYVTVTYDMDNDGYFTESNQGVFPVSGNETIAVRAESDGGVTISFFTLSVQSAVLDLFLTFSAVSYINSGDFWIDYTIQNYSNVPIYLKGNSYIIRDSNHAEIPSAQIGIDDNSLVFNTYLGVNASTNETLDGYSMTLVPYYYDLSISYTDGYSPIITEVYLGGAFVRQ